MRLNITRQQADILLDLLFNEQLRVSDQIGNADSDDDTRASERAKQLDDLVTKVCRLLPEVGA